MNKSDLIAVIAEKAGVTKTQAESVFNATFETITDVMKTEGKILVPGFGGFATKVREERQGRNPSTGKALTIPRAVVASFKPSTQLKESVNTTKNRA